MSKPSLAAATDRPREKRDGPDFLDAEAGRRPHVSPKYTSLIRRKRSGVTEGDGGPGRDGPQAASRRTAAGMRLRGFIRE